MANENMNILLEHFIASRLEKPLMVLF